MRRLLILAFILASCAASADLTSQLDVRLRSDYTGTETLSIPRDNLDYQFTRQWTSGTGSYSCNLVYRSSRTLASGAAESLDIRGGITDVFGDTVSFGRVKALYIENLGSTTLTFGAPDAASGWSAWCGDVADTLLIPASGAHLISSPYDGFAVSAGSDTIKISNGSGGTGRYYIWMLGTTP
jgi:hypothetical protein